jgi:predicted GNAT superfamily acetyltransferase
MSETNSIELRVCKTWDECVQCEEVQKQVWAMPDFRDVVPASFLYTAAKNGGILIGAFQAQAMVGFAFGVLGSEGTGTARRYKHTSHMLGVLSHVRVQGLGTQMKWLQRRVAMEQGLDLMTWTYDPLQAANAQLNLARLGAIARRYIPNAYGEMTDALNAGIASDRFEVEWFLSHERVRARATGQLTAEFVGGATDIYEIEWTEQGFARIAAEYPPAGDTLRVEIPADINALKSQDLVLAVDWRERTRATFGRAFERGYVACDVLRQMDGAGRARVWYILRRGDF